MHEFSIVEAVIEQVVRHTPPGARVRSVRIEAGPMRGIVGEAMQWAWSAATADTSLAGSHLELIEKMWTLECPACGTRFAANEMFAPCACGCDLTTPVDSDDLRLLSIEVDPSHSEERQQERHAGSHY